MNGKQENIKAKIVGNHPPRHAFSIGSIVKVLAIDDGHGSIRPDLKFAECELGDLVQTVKLEDIEILKK